jgi:hypothetical protein
VHILYAQLTHCEACFVYTGSLCTRTQDVGFDGNVVGVCYPDYFVEEASVMLAWGTN